MATFNKRNITERASTGNEKKLRLDLTIRVFVGILLKLAKDSGCSVQELLETKEMIAKYMEMVKACQTGNFDAVEQLTAQLGDVLYKVAGVLESLAPATNVTGLLDVAVDGAVNNLVPPNLLGVNPLSEGAPALPSVPADGICTSADFWILFPCALPHKGSPSISEHLQSMLFSRNLS